MTFVKRIVTVFSNPGRAGRGFECETEAVPKRAARSSRNTTTVITAAGMEADTVRPRASPDSVRRAEDQTENDACDDSLKVNSGSSFMIYAAARYCLFS